jgi:hypothetical protein
MRIPRTELSALLTRHAHRAGIRRLTAVVASDNLAAVELLQKLGDGVRLVRGELGILEYEINVTTQSARPGRAGASIDGGPPQHRRARLTQANTACSTRTREQR